MRFFHLARTFSIIFLVFLHVQADSPYTLMLNDRPQSSFDPVKFSSSLPKETLDDSVKNKVLRAKDCKQSLSDIAEWESGISTNSGLPAHYINGQQQCLAIKSGRKTLNIPVIYHNRNSDTLVILAHGFGDCKEKLSPFLWIFDKYDVVSFDFRGHGVESVNFSKWGKLTKKCLNLSFDSGVTRLGQEEEQEVLAVSNHFKKQKKYKNVVGLGLCFGAAMMFKAQAQDPNLFTHLIVDGIWPDFNRLKYHFLSDPGLISRPCRGSYVGRFIGSNWFGRKFFDFSFRCLFKKIFFKKLDVTEFAKKIKVPILFLHGQNDKLISNNEFMQVWQATTNSEYKVALLTPRQHLMHMLQNQDLLKNLFNQFVEKIAIF